MSVTGRASVDIVADLSNFASQLSADLNKAMRSIGLNFDPIATQLSEAVDKGVAEARGEFEQLDLFATGSLMDIADTARKAGEHIGDRIGEGADKATKELSKIPKAAKEAGDGLNDALDKSKEKAALVGVAIGAAITEGIATGLEKSQLDTTLAAQLGFSVQEAARVGQISGQVYGDNFGQDLPEVEAALKGVFQSGLASISADTDDTVAHVTERLLTVSGVLEEDSSAVARAVSQMLRTGLADSAEEAMDLLVAATQRGVNKSEDLLDTVNEYGTQFRKLGLDGPHALGLVSQAIQAGARDSDIAADALKEFSIRAVDGSTQTAQGFKDLGLSATAMAEIIGKGGASASKGLDLVLDRLRGIKDPVKQSQIAVMLFGTQAEDLGKALFAMDLDTATAQFGDLAGATDKASSMIGTTGASRLETFKRELKLGIIDQMNVAAGVIADNQTAFTALGIALASVGAIVVAVGAVQKVYATYTAIATAVTKAWTLAIEEQKLAFLTSPIGLIIIAVVALAAAFYLAYTRSETFRNIVQTALHAIGDAALWLWHSAIMPAFDGIMIAVHAVAAAAVWLWQNVLSPTITAIATAAMWLYTNVFKPTFDAIVAVVQVVGAIFGWLFSVIGPPLMAIAGLVWSLYKLAFAVVFGLIETGVKILGAIFMWLYENAIRPQLVAVGALFQWLWNVIISPIVNLIMFELRILGAVFSFVYNTFVKPYIEAIASVIGWLYNNIVAPLFRAVVTEVRTRIEQVVATALRIKSFVENLSANFTSAVNAVRSRIDQITSIVKGLPNRIVSALGNLASLLYNAGRNVVQGLIDGIESKFDALKSKVSSVAKTIRDFLPFSPAKTGPLSGSGAPDIAGAKITTMVADGMISRVAAVQAAARSLAGAARVGQGLDVYGGAILADAMATGAAPAGAGSLGGGATTITFAPGSIAVNFTGAVPTPEQATMVGQAIGQGIAGTLARTNVTTQIRTI